MGLRYRIPFADSKKNKYEVQIFREDYTGEAKELRAAPSCFVVSGTSDDFMYIPIRCSTATMSVMESELLLDLYSFNAQYAQVKLMRNGVLEWTGYIKPEQFTQPYLPSVQMVSVECVCALSTLEYIMYEQQTESGYITMWDLLKYIVNATRGGYRNIYMQQIYKETKGAADSENVLNKLLLCEENFLSQEMNLYEVLENVCKFLNWTVHDIGGSLYFVDADWRGNVLRYTGTLDSTPSSVAWTGVVMQEVGYNGSDVNLIDIVPGYNKASVRSVNHIFEDVIKEEPYEILDTVQTWNFNEGDFENARRVVREFKKPMMWKMYYYGSTLMNEISEDEAFGMNLNGDVIGCMELVEKSWHVTESGGKWVPKESEYDVNNQLMVVLNGANLQNDYTYKAFTVKGVNSVWKDGAFGLGMQLTYRTKFDYVTGPTFGIVATYLYFKLRIGDYCWNGEQWVEGDATFRIMYNVNVAGGFQPIPSNKTAEMPYKGLSGWVIELPSDRVLRGELELTMYINDPQESGCDAYIIRDFKLDYAKKDGSNNEGEKGDRIYENVVNDQYMSDADEIEFGIGSYNKDGATYSKVLLNDKFLTNNLYCRITDGNIRPEELMIRRIVNRYGSTKIKLTESLQMTNEIHPMAVLSDRTMVGKEFRMTSGTWDYEQNRLTIEMQEDVL